MPRTSTRRSAGGAADLLDRYGAERQPVGAEAVSRTSGRMAKTIDGEEVYAAGPSAGAKPNALSR